jgi:hypothetical protein
MLVVTATIFQMLNPSYGTFKAQPETADLQQRLRVAADTVQKDLIMAGAGMYSGQMVGTLDAYFSPLLPHKVGTVSPDPAGTFHANPNCPTTCAEAVTIMYVPTTTAQTTLAQDMPTPSSELKVNPEPGCPVDGSEQLCGFKEGMRVLIMSPNGDYDIFTITNVQDALPGGLVDHRSGLGDLLPPGRRRQHAATAVLQRLRHGSPRRRQHRRLSRGVLRRSVAA